jgi:hypothetical protein
MATNFPTSVDVLTNPVSNDSLNSPSHSAQHANANDAIEAVEDYLLNGAGKSGLVHLNTTTLTGLVRYTISNVFSTTYDNYKIVFNGSVATTRQFIYLQMTGAATNYYWGTAGWRATGAAYNANSNNTLPGFMATFGDLDNRNFASMDIGSPFLSQLTNFASTFVGGDATSTLNGTCGGFLLDSNSYTAFDIVASNIITGKVSVYGYRK